MKALCVVAAVLVAVAVSGCVTGAAKRRIESARPQLDALKVERDAGKITWTEWAERGNEIVRSAAAPAKLPPRDEQLLAFRALLASRVDAKQMTKEEATYAIAKAQADMAAEDDARRAIAAQQAAQASRELGDGLIALSQANRPVTTNCNRLGNSVSCTTY